MNTFPAQLEQVEGNAPDLMGEIDVSVLGYEEAEFLVTGVAASFDLQGERGTNGEWVVAPGTSAEFCTRILVRRPTDPQRFSGTVVVEWNNVSGGIDASPDWALLHRHIATAGHAWVGVSAQKVGIDGGGFVDGLHLKLLAPDRYRTLVHPGDAWSFDMFSQVGLLLRDAKEDGPLRGLEPKHILALGESQSAACLVTYINAIDPIAKVFDGFFVHGRPGLGVTLNGEFLPSSARTPKIQDVSLETSDGGERIRDDVRVPVLVFQSETDVIVLGGGQADQSDTDSLRIWELAGAAHADTYLLNASRYDDGTLDPSRLADLLRPTSNLPIGQTDSPIKAGPQQHYVGQAALSHLVAWVAERESPPRAPRLDRDPEGPGFRLDQYGNALGGIRNPWVEVPTAILSGLGQTGETFAMLFGRTEPFDDSTLSTLYPGGKAEYLEKFKASLDTVTSAGFILAEDRAEILELVARSFPLVAADS
jgi:Alpha/beta hydrolase domain